MRRPIAFLDLAACDEDTVAFELRDNGKFAKVAIDARLLAVAQGGVRAFLEREFAPYLEAMDRL
jgi:hypothetical protein